VKSFTLLCLLLLLPSVGLAQPKEATRLQDMINHARELRALMQSDSHRPIYHFVVPEGQLADPNGALYWKGKYHLGYVYVKFIDGKQYLVWGHAVSTDLLHWTQYPDMLDVNKG
jgi:sucrose-6-phosphate hydrolase SacC (GH32 family)